MTLLLQLRVVTIAACAGYAISPRGSAMASPQGASGKVDSADSAVRQAVSQVRTDDAGDLPWGAASGAGPAEIGKRRPALELDAVDGSLVNEGRVAGRVLIVKFFATWCRPCHQALIDIAAATAGQTAQQSQLVLVSLGESPEVVRGWLSTAAIPVGAIVALDTDGIGARRWGAKRLPTTFLVDRSGVVRRINRGWGPGYRARIMRWLGEMGAAATTSPPTPPSSPR